MRIKTNTKIDEIKNEQIFNFLIFKKTKGINKRQAAGLDGTTASYTTVLQEFEEFFQRTYNLSDEDLAKHNFCTLTFADIQLYSQYTYLEKGNKASTHNKKLNILRSFIAYLIKFYKQKLTREELYDLRDLSDDIADSTLSVEREEKAFFTKKDIMKLHHTILYGNLKNKEALLALFLLYRDTSDRRDEIRFMDVDDIHIDGKTEPFAVTSAKNKGMASKSHYLKPDTVQALKEYLAVRKPKDPNDPALFISTHGTRFASNTIYNWLKKLYVEAGFGYYDEKGKPVSEFGTHSLRHSVLTEAIFESGLAEARVMAGHSSSKVTERYMHVTEEQKIKIRDSIFQYDLDFETERRVN